MSQALKFPGPCVFFPPTSGLHFLPAGKGEGVTEGPGGEPGCTGRESAGLPGMPLHSPGHAMDEKTQAREGKPSVHSVDVVFSFPAQCSSKSRMKFTTDFGGHRVRSVEPGQEGPSSHRPKSGLGREVGVGGTPAVLSSRKVRLGHLFKRDKRQSLLQR